jgi:hypothetical protein
VSPEVGAETPVISEALVIPQALLDEAKRVLASDRPKKAARCTVCGEDCAPNSNEGLCWVCRRLKSSAWHDSDAQLPLQE